MSNVLKALKKSEQGYKALQTAQAMHEQYQQEAKKPTVNKKETDRSKTDKNKTDKNKTDRKKADNQRIDSQKTDIKKTDTKKTDRKKAWFIFILFIFPSLILAGILLILHKKQLNNEHLSEITMDTIALPYPNLSSLADLPEPAPREVVLVTATTDSKENAFNQYATAVNEPITPSQPITRPTVTQNQSQTSSGSSNADPTFDNIDLSGVSPDIAQIFQDALNETKAPQTNPTASDFQHPVVNLVGNEQQYRRRLPAMNLETHIYSANRASWVKINGKDIKENELVPNTNVRVEQILPGSLIVQFEGQYIQIPALYEWKG